MTLHLLQKEEESEMVAGDSSMYTGSSTVPSQIWAMFDRCVANKTDKAGLQNM